MVHGGGFENGARQTLKMCDISAEKFTPLSHRREKRPKKLPKKLLD